MTKPIESVVRNTLDRNKRGILFKDAYHKAWDEVEEKYLDRNWWRRKSTRAHLVWEHAIKNAIDALVDDSGVHVVSHHDTISFVIDDRVLVRVKKADNELRSRNYPTQLALLYHEPQADLFGFEGYQRVEVVYVLNQLETKIDWVGIVARENSQILWRFELEDNSTNTAVLPLSSSISAQTPANLAKLKKGKTNKYLSDERQ